MNKTKNITNVTFAIVAANPAMPPKPKAAETMATTKNNNVQ